MRSAARALAVVAAAVAASGAACSAGAPVTARPVDRVLVVALPGVGWSDLEDGALPRLAAWTRRAAVADVSTRVGRRAATVAEAYLTIGAGTRAVSPRTGAGLALEPDERYGPAPAQELLLRRIGVSPAGIGYLTIGAARDVNDTSPYGADVGWLGDELTRAGVGRAVVANADGTESGDDDPGYERPAVTALMDGRGLVPSGAVGRSLLESHPASPFGVRLGDEALAEAFAEAWGTGDERRVVLVEASDLARVEAYRSRSTPAQSRRLRAEALRRADELVAGVLDRIDTSRDAVLVLSPVSPPGRPDLGMVALRAPGIDGGLLRSPTTRRDGYVQLADVAPTILTLLGEDPPGDIEGRAFRLGSGSGDDPEHALARAADDAQFRADMLPVVTLAFVAALALLVAARVAGPRVRIGRRAVGTMGLAVLGAVPATFAAGAFDAVRDEAVPYASFVVLTGTALAAGGRLVERRWPRTAVIVVLGALVALLLVDVMTGARLQVNTVFGYSVAVAGRFAGLGNLAFALLSSSALLLAVLVARRFGRRGLQAALAVLVAVVLVDGLPIFGSDVGGVLAMVPAFGLTALGLLDRRIGWRQVALLGLAAAAAVVVFAFADLARPEEARTHLARLAEHLVHLRGRALGDAIGRRGQASFGTPALAAWAALALLFIAVGTYLVLLTRRGRGRRGPVVARPDARPAVLGLALLGALGLLANDSSFAVPAMMLIVAVPVLWLSEDAPLGPTTGTAT